jgi:hypothetical protein
MTCRHAPGDPNCSSSPQGRAREAAETARYYEKRLEERQKELDERTPDPDKFEVDEVEQVGPHLVLRVKYPSCRKCAFEGKKVMVILNATLKDVIKWKRIDPHFRDPKKRSMDREAPTPCARFPATPEGWADAMEYASWKASESRGPSKLTLATDPR